MERTTWAAALIPTKENPFRKPIVFSGAVAFTIGRHEDVDITLGAGLPTSSLEKMISREHATMTWVDTDPGTLLFSDTSLNGVFVNEERVEENGSVAGGDVIRFGIPVKTGEQALSFSFVFKENYCTDRSAAVLCARPRGLIPEIASPSFNDFKTRKGMDHAIWNFVRLVDIPTEWKAPLSYKRWAREDEDAEPDMEVEASCTCHICSDVYIDPHVLTCGHIFCRHCIKEWLTQNGVSCPVCRVIPDAKPARFLGLDATIGMVYRRMPESRRAEIEAAETRRRKEEAHVHNNFVDMINEEITRAVDKCPEEILVPPSLFSPWSGPMIKRVSGTLAIAQGPARTRLVQLLCNTMDCEDAINRVRRPEMRAASKNIGLNIKGLTDAQARAAIVIKLLF